MRSTILVEVICFLLALLFSYAAISKAIHFETFRIQVAQSPLLTGLGERIVWIILVVEILVSLMLLLPRFQLSGLYASYFLMLLFTEYIIAILYYSPHIPCSCGGILEQMGWEQHLVFNICCIALSIWGIISKEHVISKVSIKKAMS